MARDPKNGNDEKHGNDGNDDHENVPIAPETHNSHASHTSHTSATHHPLLPPRGDYRTLLSFRKAEVVYDITFRFCHKFLATVIVRSIK